VRQRVDARVSSVIGPAPPRQGPALAGRPRRSPEIVALTPPSASAPARMQRAALPDLPAAGAVRSRAPPKEKQTSLEYSQEPVVLSGRLGYGISIHRATAGVAFGRPTPVPGPVANRLLQRRCGSITHGAPSGLQRRSGSGRQARCATHRSAIDRAATHGGAQRGAHGPPLAVLRVGAPGRGGRIRVHAGRGMAR
jgi:hypothetical protein